MVTIKSHIPDLGIDVFIDDESGTSVHMQIAESLKAAILEERLQARDRLPSVRKLATAIGVARFQIGRAHV